MSAIDAMSRIRTWARQQRNDVTVRQPAIELGDFTVRVFDWSTHRLLAAGSPAECLEQLRARMLRGRP